MSEDKISKQLVHETLAEQIKDKLALIKDSIAQLKQSAAEDTKSSAGDKYETGREMVRQELDKAEKMQGEYLKQLKQLGGIKPEGFFEIVQPGSLLITDRVTLYIAVSFGKVTIHGQDIFVISPQAPLARVLLGKKAGDQVLFNGVKYQVSAVQ
ncbi:GreA/GreB family elongation factor [Echinicola marina]|uniref:GreA/GreB family elongation factor n=1 Tax=Echinicola marina TaxID=2859768 RepID=UPI001CF68C18|nr:GreA/GreB family elongation factor [Echinicola marina]UCS95310.1 GreA/GreB family elongation factor [Echinicola marina]